MTHPLEQGGCGLQGVPGENDKFTTVDPIIQILTCIIYTCSVAHAATNFPQYDQYAFPPNYPGLMKGKPQSCNVSERTDRDQLNNQRKKQPEKDTLSILGPRICSKLDQHLRRFHFMLVHFQFHDLCTLIMCTV